MSADADILPAAEREAPVPIFAKVSSVKIEEPLRPSEPPPEIRLIGIVGLK